MQVFRDSNFSAYRSSDFIILKKFSIIELSRWFPFSTYFELYDALQAFSDIRSVGIANLDQNEVRVRQCTYQCFIEHVIYLFKMKYTLLHFIFLGISPNNLMSALTIEPVRCLQRTSPYNHCQPPNCLQLL